MSVWNKVMSKKKNDKRHTTDGSAWQNDLTEDELMTIFTTADFFGANMPQIVHDLGTQPSPMNINGEVMLVPPPRFPVFDWLAMGVMSDRIGSEQATKVFAHSFLKVDGDIDKFIEDLRTTDYQVDTSWEKIDLTA